MKIKSLFKNKFFTYSAVAMVAVFLGILVLFGVLSPVLAPTSVTVSRGASVASVTRMLTDNDLIISDAVFKTAVRFNGGKIQTGEYDIPPRASAWRIARMMANGRVATTKIIIPEGLTIKQTKQLLLAYSALTGAVDCDGNNNAPVCNLHDGEIFPDTYYVAKGTPRLAVLELARKKMDDIHNAWEKTGKIAPAPLKTWNEILTLASIVQKETPRESEMPVVASVYINRLNKNMRLQADPTIVYALTGGLGDMRGTALLRKHLKIDSPYNTYTHAGLPPAPIANVGRAAIRAVLRPADTNYLYFVADGRGGHKFAKSYAEHQKNHADWREIKKIKNKK